MVDPKEGRVEARKILRCSAHVILTNSTLVKAKTIDISMSGISLMLDEPLATSQQCMISFEAPANGKIVKVAVAARSVYCTCVGTSGFRVGFQFDQRNEAGIKSVRLLLQ